MRPSSRSRRLATVLARAFVTGDLSIEQITARAGSMLGKPWRWLRPLAARYVQTVKSATRPRHRDVVNFLLHDTGFTNACLKYHSRILIARAPVELSLMQPVASARHWDLPPIESTGELAEWLQITTGELDWFADLKGLASHGRVAHYHYRALAKSSGAVRLIEVPKPRVKQLQRQILTEILNRIPAHAAAQGFVKGRSVRTFAGQHVGQRVILRMDLQDFFVSISGARVQTVFRTLGYPEPVADLLGGICTNATLGRIWNGRAREIDPQSLFETRTLYGRPHLPQGAPTSPALANICFYRADCRLTGLARTVGANYSRYADDLAFSGGEAFERCVKRFMAHVAAILTEEGFHVHYRKTRIMRPGVQQRLTGLVVNQRINTRRGDFDRLKATLTNCVRLGQQSQNHDAHPNFRMHLEGRVAHVESINPEKGKRLRAILDRISWP